MENTQYNVNYGNNYTNQQQPNMGGVQQRPVVHVDRETSPIVTRRIRTNPVRQRSCMDAAKEIMYNVIYNAVYNFTIGALTKFCSSLFS